MALSNDDDDDKDDYEHDCVMMMSGAFGFSPNLEATGVQFCDICCQNGSHFLDSGKAWPIMKVLKRQYVVQRSRVCKTAVCL